MKKDKIVPLTKICSKNRGCGIEKPSSDFRFRSDKEGVLRYICRECENRKLKEFIKKYPEKSDYKNAEVRYRRIKTMAKYLKYEFTLTYDEFENLTIGLCFYCEQKTKGKQYVGIDRIDSNKHYTLDNCVPCCYSCNRAKMDMEQKEFAEHIRKIFNCLKLKGFYEEKRNEKKTMYI